MLGLGLGISAVAARRVGAGGGGGVPVNSAVPVISGTAAVGATLTATTGTWSGSPSSYAYTWKRAGTVIPNTIGNACLVPPNAATETITVEVVATNGSGPSSAAASAATGTIAATYLANLTTTLRRGVWSPCQVLVSGYSGALIDIDMDGVTKVCSPTAKGLLDIADIITWWEARASYTGYGGVMPRVSKIYSQGTETTAHLVQTTDARRPIFDLNLVQDDGTIPVCFNGYNARSTKVDGTALAVSESGTSMNCATTTLTFNASNHGVLIVAEGVSNVGTASTGQNALIGMNTSTASNRFSLRVGNSSWSAGLGAGVFSGTTAEGPASPLQVPGGRVLIMETQSTAAANVIDGFTPSGANAAVNVRVNNDVASGWSANTIARTSGSGSSAGFHIGRTGTGTAYTGTAFGFYGAVYASNCLVTAADGDQRDAISDTMMQALGVRTGQTTNVAIFGSSSIAGYAGTNPTGISARTIRGLGPKVRGAIYGLAGSSNTNFSTNKVALSAAAKRTGLTNIAVHFNARNDLTSGTTGAATWALVAAFVDQLYADGWDKIFVCTLLDSLTGGAPSQATYDAERAAYNALVLDAGEQAAHHFTGINTAALTEFATRTDYAYYDDQIHTRGTSGAAAFASAIVAAAAPFVV